MAILQWQADQDLLHPRKFFHTRDWRQTCATLLVMINGVMVQKLQTLDEVLLELRSLGQVTTEQLQQDWRTRRAIERDLQVLIEVMIDVCQRLIALAGLTPTATAREAVERCVQLGALSQDETYHRMVQFRNFIVHHYDHVDTSILVEIVNQHLSDIERFRDEILAYVQR
jgi:uncharacterized protein YutE (UPF0331/DUF86 family)